MRKKITSKTIQILCSTNCETQKMCKQYPNQIKVEKENGVFFLSIPKKILYKLKTNKNLNKIEQEFYT